MRKSDSAPSLPSHIAMAWPTLTVIIRTGGSATNAEIVAAVADDLHLSHEQRALLRKPRGSRTLLDYRLAWSRTLLHNMGAITNDALCHWSVTDIGYKTTPDDIERFAKAMFERLGERSRLNNANG
jgi:restriction system protein